MTSALLPIFQAADKHIAQELARHAFSSPCKKGCDACCHGMNTTIDILEALELLNALGMRHGEAYTYAMGPTLYEHSKMLADRNMTSTAWQRERLPCPVLKDHACDAYEVRPAHCRAWVSLDDPAKCSIPNEMIRCLDNTWPLKLLPHYEEIAHESGIPPSSGPLQFQMLLGMLIATIGREEYARRVKGTSLSTHISALAWTHLEDPSPEVKIMQTMAPAVCQAKGVRYLSPLEVLDWPEMRAIGGV